MPFQLILAAICFAKECAWFRRFQHGITQQYLLYILMAAIIMMSTMIPFKELITRFFVH